MAVVIVIEPHALLRLGILQHLAEVLPMARLEGADYSALERVGTSSEETDLVLLSLPPEEDISHFVHAVQRTYAPRALLLQSDTPGMPPAWQAQIRSLPPETCGYISRDASPDVLAAAVRLVLVGGKCFQEPIASTKAATLSCPESPDSPGKAKAVPRPPAGKADGCPVASLSESDIAEECAMLRLTPRQYEVLVLLARGYPLKMVSRQLNISVATAKAHTETLYQRLDAHNRNEAVYAAISRGATLGWQQLETDKDAGPAPT